MHETPLLSVRDLHVAFPVRSALLRRTVGLIHGVSGVSFDLMPGRTMGLVGESGSGKSTTAKAIVGLEPIHTGEVWYDGKPVGASDWSAVRRNVQVIFQDPYGSLNPRKTVYDIISEPWLIHRDVVPRDEWPDAVDDLLGKVGLRSEHATRYPHEFSGGQRQRIGIARALALRPRVIICDEPVAALDVSVQAQVVNLLRDLQDEFGLSYLFIAHDLAVVRQMCDSVAVMYLGKIVEHAEPADLYERPQHPYTEALLSAVPPLRPWNEESERILLHGEPGSLSNLPSGCAFHPRCPRAQPLCATRAPALDPDTRPGALTACHFPASGAVPVATSPAVA